MKVRSGFDYELRLFNLVIFLRDLRVYRVSSIVYLEAFIIINFMLTNEVINYLF